MVRRDFFYAAALALLVLFDPSIISARHISRSILGDVNVHPDHAVLQPNTKDGSTVEYWEGRAIRKGTIRGPDTLQVAGSRLPDCSRACGSCSPCRLVMVSFVCSSLEEAETCPMAYKCMCHNKSYPVP